MNLQLNPWVRDPMNTLTKFNHTDQAIAGARPNDGWTGWDLDDYADNMGWDGVGILPIDLNRDADCITRSNWDSVMRDLVAQFGADQISDAQFGHWAVGWVRTGTYNAGNAELTIAVAAIRKALNDYPIHDDDLASEYEYADTHPENDPTQCYSQDPEWCGCGRESNSY